MHPGIAHGIGRREPADLAGAQQRFGIDGNEQPTIAVLHLPPGLTMQTAAGRAVAARTFAAPPHAGHLAVADYANTGNPKLIAPDGRTTWALINMPNPEIPIGSGAVPFRRSVGYGGMLIPPVALAAAITLLPVTLAAWGPALDRHRVRKSSTTFSRGWERWGQLVVRRRWIAGATGLAMIVALAIPALSMNTGQPNTTAFPTNTPAARALEGLNQQGVPSAVVFPVQVLTHGGAAGATRVAQIAEQTPGVYTALAPASASFRQGNDAFVSVIPRQQGSTSAGRALIDTLRLRLTSVPGCQSVGQSSGSAYTRGQGGIMSCGRSRS